MKTALARIALVLATLATLSGCVYDPYYPYGYPPPPQPSGPSTFDLSWNAAGGAMRDQNLQIMVEDRASGVIEGQRGGINVKTRVSTQADGKVRVEFNTGGATSEDPRLAERLTQSYQARMGR